MASELQSRCRLLLADDNPAIHDDIQKILAGREDSDAAGALDDLEAELFGSEAAKPDFSTLSEDTRPQFDVDSAFQGQQALELVNAAQREGRPYAVAFIDVRMPPGWDGVRTIRELWNCDPKLQMVICTAYSDYSWEQIAKQLGHSDRLSVLKKPFDPIEILQLAHALAAKWVLERQVDRRLSELEADVVARSRALERKNADLVRQISQREQAEEKIRYVATHDSLTGLPNRILLYDRLNGAMERAKRHDNLMAVLMVDLDHFKEVNDLWGHGGGDEVLRQVAGRIAVVARACDTVARMGGDEFVLVLDDLSSAEQADVVAQRLIKTFEDPFTVEGDSHHLTPSVGISIYPSDSATIESLLKTADMAMYEAKSQGRNRHCAYAEWMGVHAVQRASMKDELCGAIERDELSLWYQPLYSVEEGKLVALEALLRWQHPEHGMVPPMQFIPIAEETGQIVDIGRWVFQRVFIQQREWISQGMDPVPITVNVSARQLHQGDIVEYVQSLISRYGLGSELFCVELTESAVMLDLEQSEAALGAMNELGLRIIIDDFGSGYSSLNRLKTLPIHALKIDRFFVQNIVDDPRDAAIVMAIIALAHSLGVKVIAEGVEAESQLERLRSLQWHHDTPLHCDEVQGFFFSRPMPPEQITELLGQR